MPLRFIHLEDNRRDAELVRSILVAEGIECDLKPAQTRADFLAALEEGADLVLADYSLPSFDGMSALSIVRERHPELPFIFVTGTLGEEVAVESLKKGATDYVLKQRLSRLVPSVRRALHEAEERLQRKRAEEDLQRSQERLLQAQRIGNMGSWEWDLRSEELIWSEQLYRIFGQDRRDFHPSWDSFISCVHPEDRVQLKLTGRIRLLFGFDFANSAPNPGWRARLAERASFRHCLLSTKRQQSSTALGSHNDDRFQSPRIRWASLPPAPPGSRTGRVD
jgi:DNA-binding response OmpR family regulator